MSSRRKRAPPVRVDDEAKKKLNWNMFEDRQRECGADTDQPDLPSCSTTPSPGFPLLLVTLTEEEESSVGPVRVKEEEEEEETLCTIKCSNIQLEELDWLQKRGVMQLCHHPAKGGAIKVDQGDQGPLCDVQHAALIPVLRPYQRQAVNWMLERERYRLTSPKVSGDVCHLSTKPSLHFLWREVVTLCGKMLFYNPFTGCLMREFPMAGVQWPGESWRTRWAWGRTVEVLALILSHGRQGLEPETLSLPLGKSVNYFVPPPPLDTEEEVVLCKAEARRKVKISYPTVRVMLLTAIKETRSGKGASVNTVSAYMRTAYGYDLPKNRNHVRRALAKLVDEGLVDRVKGRGLAGSFRLGKNYKEKKKTTTAEKVDYAPPTSPGEDLDPEHRIPSEDTAPAGPLQEEADQLDDTLLEDGDGDSRVFPSTPLTEVLEDEKPVHQSEAPTPVDNVDLLEERTSDIPQVKTPSPSPLPSPPPATRASLTPFNTADYRFECICGELGLADLKARVQCMNCQLWQHAECVNYREESRQTTPFYCPHCLVAMTPVATGATLIISPSSICQQWVEEINRHISSSSLRVLVYQGVKRHGFIQPHVLAQQDVVITTYDVLRSELNYVDIPHSNSVDGRRFRNQKRYMAVPSPLVAVEWWRICLDEAQMVECTTAKAAEMAMRLASVNRWCVSGTPVQRGLEDLYGLVLFLGVDPYWVKHWWDQLLYRPYRRGNAEPLYSVIGQLLWRSAKKDVIDQRLHATHNLMELLSAKHAGIPPTLRDDRLSEEAEHLRQHYMTKYNSEVSDAHQALRPVLQNIRELKRKTSVDEDLVSRVHNELTNSYKQQPNKFTMADKFRDGRGLQMILCTQTDELMRSQKTVQEAVKRLEGPASKEVIEEATVCHLRPVRLPLNNCVFCKADELFTNYESKLFSHTVKGQTAILRGDDRGRGGSGGRPAFPTTSRGPVGPPARRSEPLKAVLTFAKAKRMDASWWRRATPSLELFENWKKEYKVLHEYWMVLRNHVSAIDELGMATERLRVETNRVKLLNDRAVAKSQLHKKLGQFLYLNNLEKSQDKETGGLNPEPCPICARPLGQEWAVLTCGHCFCNECIAIIVEQYSVGSRRRAIKCAICRQTTAHAEISYVFTCPASGRDQDVPVKWQSVLDIIAKALTRRRSNILLLPLHTGSNGLNIIEATHVLLVEPILNPAHELQAIGRVHRIGQTKPTFVHRFLIKSTIEERMQAMLKTAEKSAAAMKHSEAAVLTVADLADLFTEDGEPLG
ncbi:hypothetical protein CRUP_010486 [Coryphaenoides rupestris]|nr:hypothetical protein CRUP_010486 [Coryphaenoides rupestris]